MAFHQMQPGNPKLFKLDSLLVSANYSNKNEVRKTCEELLRRYDSLDCYNIPNPDRQPARVIEIFGTVPVNFKGRTYHIMMSFIFPPLFPNVPPLVHLVNPDAKRFMALQKYDAKKTLFPNGKYYYQLNFSEIQSWMSHKSAMRILTQLIKEFGTEYPLYECSTGTTTQNLFNNPQQQINSNNLFGQNMNNAQNSATMLNSHLVGVQPNYNMGGHNQKDQVLAPLKKRYTEEALAIARKLEKDLNVQRNNMVELQNSYLKLQEEEEKLQKFEGTAPAIISDLEEKIKGLDQVISAHEGTVLNIETLKATVEEEDNASKMLLDLVTTNKAIEDVNLLIEDLFNAGKLDLDTYLKYYKDNTEREFLNNVIMKKIIMEQQTQPQYH